MKKRNNINIVFKIIATMLIILIPTFLGGIGVMAYSVIYVQRQETERTRQAVLNQGSEINDLLSQMDSYMIELLLNNRLIKQIDHSNTVNEKNVAARELIERVTYDRNTWDFKFNFSFYFPGKIEFSQFDLDSSYKDNCSLHQTFGSLITTGGIRLNEHEWAGIRLEDRCYIYKVYHSDGSYLAAWISCEELFSGIRSSVLSGLAQITYLLPEEHIPENISDGWNLELSPSRMDVTVYVSDELNKVNWRIFIFWGVFIGGVTLVGILITLYILYYYRHYIRLPLVELLHKVEIDSPSDSVTKSGVPEVNETSSAVTALVSQTKELRSALNEEKLHRAQAELEYRQVQIRPHFFVNCFSLIYAMAQQKNFIRIQDFCLKLSKYARYLFTDSFHLVPLAQELDAIREFLDIQQIRHKMTASLIQNSGSTEGDLRIPPLTLLTFVENSLKHNAGGDINIKISSSVVERDGKKHLRLSVCDNGRGFPEYMTKSTWIPLKQCDHLGIHNIYERLKLLFGNDFILRFSNEPAGGSTVLLEIPVLRQAEGLNSEKEPPNP